MSDPLCAFAPMLADLNSADKTALRVEAWLPVNASVIMAYRGAERATGEALSAFAQGNPDTTVLNTGPGTWLIFCNDGVSALPDLDDVAVTFDQGDGYALLLLNGGAAATILQKGIFVDLDKTLADNGSCVNSVIAHINVTAWRVSADVIGVAVPRSFAACFWHWLNTAASGEGLSIGR